ncbi:MAG: RNB domain-containing ribonuclease [Polyangiaceae bacterium]
MSTDRDSIGFDIEEAARKTMLDNGFLADFGPEVLAAAEATPPREPRGADAVRDMRKLPWSSIDNDESRDLDQVEVSERDGDRIRVRVAIADVDLLVPRGSPTDEHAGHNTTSVYTGVVIFPMLPERLSTDLTSLNEGVDRRALVTEMLVDAAGEVVEADVYRALIHNHAKLTYEEIGAWLEGGERPASLDAHPDLVDQVKMQDEAAQRLRALRHRRGALVLETIEARPVTVDGKVVDLALVQKSRARELVEDFMIAANGAVARFLEGRGIPNIRRVVKAPERWERLVALAAELGETLPAEPSSLALAGFLRRRRTAAPETFADLSLSVVKLMGPGEYVVEKPGEESDGHFGLAAQDYTHSTAPNRRYADLVTQRLVKSSLAGAPLPYTEEELVLLARRITERENAAKKVERQMRKVAAALFLSSRIGERFEAIVTGAASKGTFVRLLHPPAEGRVVRGAEGLDVGDKVVVELVDTAPARGFVDFACVEGPKPTLPPPAG